MNEKQLHALATEFSNPLKTPEDLNQFSQMLKKITVEAALNGELTEHLGHEKHQPRKGQNARNDYTSKIVICDEGEIEIDTARDRDGSFEPQLIKKNQTRITRMDEQINSVIRRVIKKRNVFPTDDSVFKVIWLAMKGASKKWAMPIQNWKLLMIDL